MLLSFEALGASDEAPIDRLGARGQAALQDCESEPDGVLPLTSNAVSTVHAFAHVAGHLLVERVFELGEFVGNRLSSPLGEQLLAIESQQVFFDHAPHDAAGVGGLAVLAFEPVAVEQGEEQLEILFLAGVRRRRHQQKMPGDLAE